MIYLFDNHSKQTHDTDTEYETPIWANEEKSFRFGAEEREAEGVSEWLGLLVLGLVLLLGHGHRGKRAKYKIFSRPV